jgi:hypothetical protein
MTPATILWRRLDLTGHETMRLDRDPAGGAAAPIRLRGAAVFTGGARPALLQYVIACTDAWQTRRLELTGWIGGRDVSLLIEAPGDGRWLLDDVAQPAVAGCLDLDLAFSAATNTISLRRLNLAVGQSAEVTSAWLTFPDLQLQPLTQTYRRRDESHYVYAAPALGFKTVLTLDEAGLVTDYPPLWTAKAQR